MVLRNLKVLGLLVFMLICQRIVAAFFEGCDYVFQLNPGVSYLESPNFPKPYPPYTSCRYKFKAAGNYGITVRCNINLAKGANICSTEFLYLARDGDLRLRGSEQLCGSGAVTRKSLFNIFTIAYIAGGTPGTFNCSLNVEPRPCDCGWSANTKIVNGQEATANEYPSIVALKDRTSNTSLFCSGEIISQRFIITAAHCARFVPNPARIDILVGRQNIQSTTDTQYSEVYRVSKIIEHPYYTASPTRNDIALMKTTEDIEFKRGVGPICLPPISNINNDFSYSEVSVAGWGTKSFAGSTSPTLQKITLLIVDQKTCEQTFKEKETIFPSHICTYDFSGKGKDSCQFDSGGPVILKHLSRQILIGIVSFGRSCGAGGYSTGVNERITSHLHWILQNSDYSTCYIEMK